IAKSLIDSTADATGNVDSASRLLLTNQMYVTNSVVPDLESALHVLGMSPDDAPTQRVALDLIKTVNMLQEDNKNIKSAFGRGLQSAKSKPEMEQALREIYGPEQYRAYFNPGADTSASGAARTVEEQAVDAGIGSLDDAADDAVAGPISEAEKQM